MADLQLEIKLICDCCSKELVQPIIEKSLTKTSEDKETIVMRIDPCDCKEGITKLLLNVNQEKVEIEF